MKTNKVKPLSDNTIMGVCNAQTKKKKHQLLSEGQI